MLATAINTPRTMLRRYQEDDSSKILSLVQANEERILSSFPATYVPLQKQEMLEAWIASTMVKDWEEGSMYTYGIWHKQSGDYIGQVSVDSIDRVVGKAELVYFLDQKYEGLGLMSEVLSCVVDTCFDFLQLNRIYVRILTQNERSVRLVENCGFRFEGTLREDFRTFYGRIEDVHIYGLLQEEY